jgi:murein DD-endopeptidase MepM/ murein hydrolase activator NlpD
MAIGWSPNSVIHTGLSQKTLKQINRRSETLSKVTGRDTNDIVYLNSKTSWVKISSGVDVATDSEGENYSSEIAKNNILAGGVLNSKQQIRSGIFNGKDDAYTLDSVGSGYRAIPGLTGFQSEILGTYGTYQRVAIDFQVNNIDQLSTLEQIYLRPGMNLLIEWGHSIYKKNNGNLVTTIQTVSDFFDNITSEEDQENLKKRVYDQIDTLKKNSDGNYDALLGRITNFNYKFNVDGTYGCQVVVLAHGALLESVRLLVSSTTSDDTTLSTANQARDVSRFTKFFNIILEQGLLTDTQEVEEALKSQIPEDYNLFKKRIDKTGRDFKLLSVGKSTSEDNPKDKIIKFVPFYIILEMINVVFCPKTDVNKDVNDVEFFTGDPSGENTTPYLTFPGHFSINPTICFMPKARSKGDPLSYFFTNVDESIRPSKQDNILDIMVSINYVLKVFGDLLDPSKTDRKDQSVYDFVRIILKGITESLGNLNNFDFHYEDQRDKVNIVDRKVTPNRKHIEDSVLKVRGPETTMHDFSITSKLSADLMSTMAIGASAQATDLGEDMLNVQSWNKGLRDRFNPNPGYLGDNTNSDQAQQNIQQQKFRRLLTYICNVDRADLEEDGGKFSKVIRDKESVTNNPLSFINYNAEEASAIRPVYEKVMQDLYKVQTKKEKESAAGLIPVDVSFKMTGISGFKIGQAFTIEEGTLPKKYNDKVGFIIKSLSHVIGSDNKWKTDVNGIMTILSEAKIVGRDDFDLNEFISESLTITEVPAPETPILNWVRRESSSPLGFDKAGTPSSQKAAFFTGDTYGVVRQGGGTTGAGNFGAKRSNSVGVHEGIDVRFPPNEAVYSPIDGDVRFGAEFTEQGGHFLEITGTGDYIGYKVRIAYINVSYNREEYNQIIETLNVVDYDTKMNDYGQNDKEAIKMLKQIKPVNPMNSIYDFYKGKIKAGQTVAYAADMVNGYPKQTSDGSFITDSKGKPQVWPGYGSPMENHIHFEIKYNEALIDPVKAPFKLS